MELKSSNLNIHKDPLAEFKTYHTSHKKSIDHNQ